MSLQQQILDFLNQYEECVVATVNESGQPEAATVGYSTTPQLELTIGTNGDTRKCRNLRRSPRVAVVVGFEGEATVQYEGTARELTGDELSERLALHVQKVPSAAFFKNKPDQVYFSGAPTWVRLTDYGQEPAVQELKEFA